MWYQQFNNFPEKFLANTARFKMLNPESYNWSEIIEFISSQHVFNDYDTSGSVNEFLQNCKGLLFMVFTTNGFYNFVKLKPIFEHLRHRYKI